MNATADETNLSDLLAARIRERRLELGRKLHEVAAAAGVSTSYLSSIENGGSVPSLPVLAQLSHALDLSLAEMLRTSASERLGRGNLAGGHGQKELSVEGSQMQIVRVIGKPGSSGGAPVELGGTDLFVFLDSGQLAVDVDGARFELASGDALHCDLPDAVTWNVVGDERAVALFAASAPGRAQRAQDD